MSETKKISELTKGEAQEVVTRGVFTGSAAAFLLYFAIQMLTSALLAA